MISLSFTRITLTFGVMLCPIMLISMFIWFLSLAIIEVRNKIVKRQGWKRSPCPNCIYFVDCQELKCAVNPYQALTKHAVDCRDFQPVIGLRVHDYRIKR